MEEQATRRRTHRVRHELKRRSVQVLRAAPLGRGFMRVVFGGSELADFVSAGFDDHVKLMFDGADGQPVRRDYTPRRFEAARNELTIDFALHGPGPAAAWARQAVPGQALAIGGPRGSMIVPLDFDWHLLAGDASAAPAIGRRLAELPAGARVVVVVQLDDLDVLELSQSSALIELRQVASAAALVDAVVRPALPPGEGFVWAAGEASSMAAMRTQLLHGGLHPLEGMHIAAYWKHGTADHHEDLGR